MDNNFFTSGHPYEKSENLSKEIKGAINELKQAFPEQNIEALNWDSSLIAIPLEVPVNLPSRGAVDDIDIRRNEPIFLLLDRQNYPYRTPGVYYNRKDFPAAQLPHLNPTVIGLPASFCLHRGSMDDWFAEHTITDLVNRTINWLSDAAKGHLIRREDGFEPTRINLGWIYSVFDPAIYWDLIEKNWQKSQGRSGFAFLWIKCLKTKSTIASIELNSVSIQLIQPIVDDNLSKCIEFSNRINYHMMDQNEIEGRGFGILAWPSRKRVCKKFFANLPQNGLELKLLTEELGVPLEESIQRFLSNSLDILRFIPISIVIPRPQNLIAKESHLEPINFLIFSDGKRSGILSTNTKVEAVCQRDPLTRRIARNISSIKDNFRINKLLFLGCGAIGSKIIFHLARNGYCEMTLVDYDTVSPHNLVRHALMNKCIGKNKAEAIKDIILEMYEADRDIKINVIKESALNIFLGNKYNIINEHNWLLDTTASIMVFNMLRDAVLPKTISCCRCEIADEGRLGIMSREGYKRNPRLDDLQVAIFDMAISKKEISSWLQSNRKKSEEEFGSNLSEIDIGISCSSETMKLSDDIVSLHAAYFSTYFKRIAKVENKNGHIQISSYSESGFGLSPESILGSAQQFEVKPVTIVQSENDCSWQVRMKEKVDKDLHNEFNQAIPNETGGLLIGKINQKAKIIYITDFLRAPPDSISSPCAFKMGIDDIPEEINRIYETTGGMLGYVGQWHTHPNGDIRLSSVDERTKNIIKKRLDQIHLPTHIMIVTKKGLHPYIFG